MNLVPDLLCIDVLLWVFDSHSSPQLSEAIYHNTLLFPVTFTQVNHLLKITATHQRPVLYVTVGEKRIQ